MLESMDNDIENAANAARSKAISETKKEGEENAAILQIEWTGERIRLDRASAALEAEVKELSAREESLNEELTLATGELKELHTAAVGG